MKNITKSKFIVGTSICVIDWILAPFFAKVLDKITKGSFLTLTILILTVVNYLVLRYTINLKNVKNSIICVCGSFLQNIMFFYLICIIGGKSLSDKIGLNIVLYIYIISLSIIFLLIAVIIGGLLVNRKRSK